MAMNDIDQSKQFSIYVFWVVGWAVQIGSSNMMTQEGGVNAMVNRAKGVCI